MSIARPLRDVRPGEMITLARHADGDVAWLTTSRRGSFDVEWVIGTVSDNEDHTLSVVVDGQSYRAEYGPHAFVEVVDPHHPVCGECGELWPCRDRRMSVKAARLTQALDNVCAHCGKALGGSNYDSFNDGLTTRRYHTAKSHRKDGTRCVDALAAAQASVAGVER